MEKDQYLLHDVTARCNESVILLLGTYKAAGYGIYWMLLEYLRMQHNYRGSMKTLGILASQMGTNSIKLKHVITGFRGLRSNCVTLDRRQNFGNADE